MPGQAPETSWWPLAALAAWPVGALLGAWILERRLRGRAWAAVLLHRSGWLVLTALLVFTLSFFLMRAVPGGPFDAERSLEPELRRHLEARYRLDRPLWEQYALALSGLPALDFGPCMTLPDHTVREVIAQSFPASFLLGVAALAWTLAIGIPAGVVAALRRGTKLDTVLGVLVSLGLAVPNFVLAGLLMIPLVFAWGLLPAAGLDSFSSLLLPSFCLGAPFAAQVARLTRTGMLEVLNQDWVRTARATGLPEHQVVLNHALRGALLPVVSFLGPALAGILTGSLVIEQMFAMPGLGTHFVQSALNRDYTLAMGMVMLYTVLVSSLNWVADVAHALLDPRVGRP